jgi:hypothetical protein
MAGSDVGGRNRCLILPWRAGIAFRSPASIESSVHCEGVFSAHDQWRYRGLAESKSPCECRTTFDRAASWGVLRQPQMRAILVIVIEVGLQDAAQARFIEDDHVIQTLPSNRSDQSLHVRILPGRLWRGENLPNA